MIGNHLAGRAEPDPRLGPISFAVAPPGPGVSKPEGGQEVQRRALAAPVVESDSDQDVVGRVLGIFDLDVEVAALLKNPGVEQLIFGLLSSAAAVLLQELSIRKGPLRILIERFEVGVRRGRVQIEVVLLQVFPMIALAIGQPKSSLLQNRVCFVPEREGEAQTSLAVADPQQSVFAPTIGSASRMIVREVFPASAILGIVLADRSPLPLREVGAPSLPVFFAPRVLAEPMPLSVRGLAHSRYAIKWGGRRSSVGVLRRRSWVSAWNRAENPSGDRSITSFACG